MAETATIIAIITVLMTDAGYLLATEKDSLAKYVMMAWCTGTFLWLCMLYLLTNHALLIYLVITASLLLWNWSDRIFAANSWSK